MGDVSSMMRPTLIGVGENFPTITSGTYVGDTAVSVLSLLGKRAIVVSLPGAFTPV